MRQSKTCAQRMNAFLGFGEFATALWHRSRWLLEQSYLFHITDKFSALRAVQGIFSEVAASCGPGGFGQVNFPGEHAPAQTHQARRVLRFPRCFSARRDAGLGSPSARPPKTNFRAPMRSGAWAVGRRQKPHGRLQQQARVNLWHVRPLRCGRGSPRHFLA